MEPNPASAPPAAPTSPQRVRGRGRIPAIARAAGRTCSRPGCDTPAASTLVFSYADQVARLVELLDDRSPQAYDLCQPHADRTSPPRGWELADTRPPREHAPRALDDEQTVAVIAAALRGEDPPARVSVLPGGRPTEDGLRDELATEDTPAHGDTEDPLRAALEELQRVADPDPIASGAAPTPLRADPAVPESTATVEVEEPVVAVDPPPPAADTAIPTADAPPPPDDLTLW